MGRQVVGQAFSLRTRFRAGPVGRKAGFCGHLALLLALAALAQADDSPRWRIQYFYDEVRAAFEISDLKFPTAKNGMAVGAIVSQHGVKPTSAITTDGGAHWSLAPLKERPATIFFLNDSLGWMVTDKGLWQTEEFGKSWHKLKAPPGLWRVYFLNPDRGWAVGSKKQIFETSNRGKDWTPIPGFEKIETTPENTTFAWIEFADKEHGLIGGWSKPPRRDAAHLPDWVDPQTASTRREWPHLSILADTHDAGKSWVPSTMSLFGEITTAKLSPEGWGVGLIEFSDLFEWPSEVFFLNWKAGTQRRFYREKNRKVTSVAIAAPTGPVYLGAVDHFGPLQQSPVPRKVVILRSDDAEHWTEMPVDYKATARRVILASVSPDDIWAATDTGMILKLAP